MLTTSALLAATTAHTVAHAGHWGHGGFGWWFIFPLFWIALIVLFIVGRRRGQRTEHRQAAEGVLRERYARGEIDETEFRQRLEVLHAAQRR
ncbi:SHOCT domain-containing protein [Arthrobacter sp.]|uniref:SHOCT domain-containing protein n=1 Tax=Arthrobacter sp. TaxID=1667 RepID=UPI003A941537